MPRPSRRCSPGIPQPPRCGDPVRAAGTEVIRLVVDKFIMQLDAQLAERNVEIELTMRPATGRRARL